MADNSVRRVSQSNAQFYASRSSCPGLMVDHFSVILTTSR